MAKTSAKKKIKKPSRNAQSLLFRRKRFTRFIVSEPEDKQGIVSVEVAVEKVKKGAVGYSKIMARAAKKKDKPPKGTGSTGPRIRSHR